MPRNTRDDVGTLEFELDEAEFELAGDGFDSTGSLRSDELGDTDSEFEAPDYDAAGSDYGRRFFELSLREFESDSERDAEIDAVLDDMEREYFLGGWLKKAGSALAGGAGKLAGMGAKAVGGLANQALKSGLLKPLAQTALSMVPGGSLALPALQSLGFLGGGGGGGGPPGPAANPFQSFGGFADAMQSPFGGPQSPFGGQQAPWNNLAQLFQNSFGNLAAQMQGEVTDPVQAMKLATHAFQAARNAGTATQPGGGGRQRVVHVRPGDVIVLKVVAG